MKRKRRQRWIAMLMAVVMLASTMGSTGLAQSLQNETADSETIQKQEEPREFLLPDQVKTWKDVPEYFCRLLGYLPEDGANLELDEESDRYQEILISEGIFAAKDFSEKTTDPITEEEWETLCRKAFSETVKTEEEAQNLSGTEESDRCLITADTSELTGLTAGHVSSVNGSSLFLYDSEIEKLSVCDTEKLKLKNVKTKRLYVSVADGESCRIQSDEETEIPELVITGEGSVSIEGSGSFGVVRVMDTIQELAVRATCSVINESDADISLEDTEGNVEQLQPTEQRELTLSGYLIQFVAEDTTIDTEVVTPGSAIAFPETVPEKEGCIFTSWYKDEAFTEPASQFETAEGQMVYYARYVTEDDAVTVTFDTMGGASLSPVTLAKGESLLTRPVSEIYTSQEGYTFGGWCLDEACTEGFSYSRPVEEDLTLYAFFVSDEVQSEEKEGNTAELKDFEWNGTISLTVPETMTLEEVQAAISVQAGSGENDPEITVTEQDGHYVISGTSYERDGENGFEPGSTFSLTVDGDVHFADYAEEITTLVVSVYKEQIETVAFADGMQYVLWDDVISYIPAKEQTEDDLTADAENLLESEETEVAETETETEIVPKELDDTEAVTESEAETETESETAAMGEETGSEWEMPAYTPGKIVVKGDADYQEGDLVAFYDGDIGRDEKTMDSYVEGSYDGYVLYAKVQATEKIDQGTQITFQYASPEEYLSDFDVHMTEEANLEQELSQEDLALLSSRLSRQVEENDELKAQMLVAVMSSKETQELLNEKYGEGAYSLAAMSANLRLNKPSVSLKASGSQVTADISVSATATISKDRRVILTIEPKLSFTQVLEVKMNVNGGKFWIDMSVSFLSTTKIALTISATSGGDVSVFEDAKDTFAELVKPEGIQGTYEEYDKSVQDLMETMNSIVQTSLNYSQLFDILLLRLQYSFYGIITIGFEVHLVGQVGILATFGIEIIAKSGERIGFNYNFLKFKGSSYTEKLDSSVTNNIYLIGKVGVRVGIRMVLSITICGIVKTSIIGDLFAYAELSGMYFFTANLLSGANSNFGAVKFEVGIDVIVTLSLQVRLIIKTIRKNWKVYEGRWPLWSKSLSSKLSYMNEEEIEKAWEAQTQYADNKTVFGLTTIPMKNWDLLGGKCLNTQALPGKDSHITLSIENLVVNDEAVGTEDPKNELFTVGDTSKGQSPFCIYMDENVAAEQICEKAELDLVITYENNASSALVKKQVKRLHLNKKCALATTSQHVKVALFDWCAEKWGIPAADWDNAVVYETTFTSSHMLGGFYEPTDTGILSLGEIVSEAQTQYPEISDFHYSWAEPVRDDSASVVQYSVPRISDFCYMTPDTGTVRYDVKPQTEESEVTYYLYVRRFEGYEDEVRYHVRLTGADPEDTYEFSTRAAEEGEVFTFTEEQDHTYLLPMQRSQFDGSGQPLMMSINGQEAFKTGFVITGQETQADVYFDLSAGTAMLGIQLGEGVEEYEFADPSIVTEDGIKPGTKVELKVQLKDGYGGLEALCDNESIDITVEDTTVRFTMPANGISLTLQAYKLHSITYMYHYKGNGVYKKEYFAENERTEKVKNPGLDGLTFRGWYTSPEYKGSEYQFGEKLTTDVILYADWTCDVTVHFSPAKGKAAYRLADGTQQAFFKQTEKTYYTYTYSTQRPGEKLPDLVIPEYDGYQFMDWYLNAEFVGNPVNTENYKLTGGIDLYARWARELDIIFDRNDGSSDQEHAKVTGYNGYPLPVVPDDPERLYYTFTGWYHDRAATDPFDLKNEILNWDTIIYAGWKANVYQITYDLGGGTNAAGNPDTYTTEDTVTLQAPSRTGYTFKGWTGTGLKAASATVQIPAGNGGDRSYIAIWEPITYQISYKRTFGTATDNPNEYTIESPEIVLIQPTREKYQFEGWIGTDLEEPTLEVHIPNGSIGERAYTATWSTTDPVLSILDRIQELAAENPYEGNLSDYLQTEDFMKDTRDYDRIEKQLLEIVKAHLEELVKADKKIGAYSDQIQIDLVLNTDATNRELPDRQQYRFSVTATYTDDDGNTTSEEPFEQEAVLQKIIPTPVVPETSRLNYGKPVGESVFSDDGKGVAQYVNKDLGLEIPVSGAFSWKETEKGKVPFGRNNGMEKSQYTAIFTPDETMADVFAPAECLLDVKTQVGLYLTGTADDRVYHYDEGKGSADISCTGTVTLVYAKEDGSADTEEFTEVSELLSAGTWTLDNGNIGKRTATYQGFALDTDKNSDGMYYLINQKITYQITVTPQNEVIQTSPVTTEQTSYEYGTKLNNIGLNQTDVKLKYADGNWVSGTSSWAGSVDTNTVPNAGTSNYPITFTPDTKYQGGYGTYTHASYTAAVVIDKKKVEIPTVSDKTYNGATQTSGLSETETYTILQDVGGKNATDQPYVTLQLRDKENYVWASKNADGTYTEQGSEDYKITYQIQKADLQLQKSANASITDLQYGQLLTDVANPGKETMNEKCGEVQRKMSSGMMLRGYTASYQGANGEQSADGSWSWVTENESVFDRDQGKLSQPLNVKQADGKILSYNIKIRFTPKDSNLNGFETYVPVKVGQTTLKADVYQDLWQKTKMHMYQPKNNPVNKIGDNITLEMSGSVYSPYFESEINGTWGWSDPNAMPNRTTDTDQKVKQSVTFVPNSDSDKVNYKSVGKTCDVTLRNGVYSYRDIIYKGASGLNVSERSSGTLKETDNHVYHIKAKSGWYLVAISLKWTTSNGTTEAVAECYEADNKIDKCVPANFMKVKRDDDGYIVISDLQTVPQNDVHVGITMAQKDGFKKNKSRMRIQSQTELGTEILTEAMTEPQTSSQDTESSEPESTTSNPAVPETTMTESQTTETTAPETQTPETEPPQTQAPETESPETNLPETSAPQTEPPAPETSAPQTEPPAPETAAPQAETSAPPQPAETQAAEIQSAESMEPVQNSGDS